MTAAILQYSDPLPKKALERRHPQGRAPLPIRSLGNSDTVRLHDSVW